MLKMTLEEEFLRLKTKEELFDKVIKFGVVLKKIPPSTKIKDVKKLLQGVRVKNVLFGKGGKATVVLASEEDQKKALLQNGAAIGNHKVVVRPLSSSGTVVKKRKGKDEKEPKREFFPSVPQKKMKEDIEETGRLYVRNLSYEATEKELDELFAPFGLLTEVHVPYDLGLKRNRGYAFVTFVHPKDAVKAFKSLDKSEFQGRKLHVLPGKESTAPDPADDDPQEDASGPGADSSFKRRRLAQLRREAGTAARAWNPLFVSPAAVAEVQAAAMGVAKEQLLDAGTRGGSAAVRLAQVELALVGEVEEFLADQGVLVERLKAAPGPGGAGAGPERSRSAFLIKNLPAFTSAAELEPLLAPHGDIERLAVAPKGVLGLVEFRQAVQARRAFAFVAYAPFKDAVLKVEWAPMRPRARAQEASADEETQEEGEEPPAKRKKAEKKQKKTEEKRKEKAGEEEKATKPNVVLVRNVPFQTSRRELEQLVRPFGSLVRVRLPKKSGGGIRGFAFVEFEDAEAAEMLIAADTKLHLYGRRLRMEPALAETDLSQVRAAAFESLVSGQEAEQRRRKKEKQ